MSKSFFLGLQTEFVTKDTSSEKAAVKRFYTIKHVFHFWGLTQIPLSISKVRNFNGLYIPQLIFFIFIFNAKIGRKIFSGINIKLNGQQTICSVNYNTLFISDTLNWLWSTSTEVISHHHFKQLSPDNSSTLNSMHHIPFKTETGGTSFKPRNVKQFNNR